MINTDIDITQRITVTTSGTPVQGPEASNQTGWVLSAVGATCYFMFHGQTATNKGFPLVPGSNVWTPAVNLRLLDFDSDSNGGIICATKFG